MPKRPNIIFIVLDSLRADHVSCYGYNRRTTPNIDMLSNEGIVFKNAISPGIATTEVHASWFTGLYLPEHGIHSGNKRYINRNLKVLPEILKKEGYKTVAFSDNPYVSRNTGMDRGFGEFYDTGNFDTKFSDRLSDRVINKILKAINYGYLEYSKKYRVERVIDKIIEWLKHKKDSNPYFLFSLIIDTHIPHFPPLRYRRRFLKNVISEEKIRIVNSSPVKVLSGEVSLSTSDYEILKDLYDANISFVDDQLNRLFREIRSYKFADNTMLIITADHGDQFGEHGLIGHSMSLYDTLIKVPLIIWYPMKITDSIVYNHQVQTIDLFTTILKNADIDVHENNNGRIGADLIGIGKKNISNNTPAFVEHGFWKHEKLMNHPMNYKKWCIRTNSFKLIKSENNKNEFYDLVRDPGETMNLIEKDIPERIGMEKVLDKIKSDLHMRVHEDLEKKIKTDADFEERLKGLGYM
jgi:arylsulfatase A-like enzyme